MPDTVLSAETTMMTRKELWLPLSASIWWEINTIVERMLSATLRTQQDNEIGS